MLLDQLPPGARVVLDSNILVHHFQPHPTLGSLCHRLIERIEKQDLEGPTSTNLLGELAHRLMVIEAGTLPGLKAGKVLSHLKQQPTVVQPTCSSFEGALPVWGAPPLAIGKPGAVNAVLFAALILWTTANRERAA